MKNLKSSLLSLLLAVMLVFGSVAPVLPAFADEQLVPIEEAVKLGAVPEGSSKGEAEIQPIAEPTAQPVPTPAQPALLAPLPSEGVPQLLEGAAQPTILTNTWEAGDFIYQETEQYEGVLGSAKIKMPTIMGFSESGKIKIANTKSLILPNVDPQGKAIYAIGDGAFKESGIKEVVLPNQLKLIGASAFEKNEITSVQCPSTLTIIGTGAFRSNKINQLSFNEGLLSMGMLAFVTNELAGVGVIVPESVVTMNLNVFVAKVTDPMPQFTYKKIDVAIVKGEEAALLHTGHEKLPNLRLAIENAKAIDPKRTLPKAIELADAIYKAIEDFKPAVIENIEVPSDVFASLGMSQSDALKQLPSTIRVTDSKKVGHDVPVQWNLIGYNAGAVGDYQAKGIIELPTGILQSTPATPLEVTIKLKVVNAISAIADYTYNGAIITGFSESGKEKFKTCKMLVLPARNPSNQAITEVGDKAFLGQIATRQDPSIGINSVILPSTITTIGKEAFRYNALKSIALPEGLTTIKDSAFNGNLLQSLFLPDTVTKLEVGAFTLNEIATLKLSNKLKTIPVAFGYNKLTTVTIPEGVTKIDDMAFSDNDLREAKLPSTLGYLSGFNNNEFASITIPKSVKVIGKKAFARNRIKEVVIPGNVISIGESAFQNSWHDVYLEKVTLEEGVQKLDKFAFSSNQLREVNLPASLKEIDSTAFYKNLGYNETLVTHLFTPDLKNPKSLKNAKYHQINPAKLTINYVLNGKIEKTETIVTHPESKVYFTIGDTVSIKPSFKHTAYGLADPNAVNITLNGKENTLEFKLQNKVIVDTPVIETVGRVPAVAVEMGTALDAAMKKLSKKSCIFDSNGKEYAVDLTWKVESFDGNKPGEYRAKATFTPPTGVSITGSSLKPELETLIIVKQNPSKLKSNAWTVDDFVIENTEIYGDNHIAVMGFSAKGEEKLKTNTALVIPKTNANGDFITAIYQEAFEDKGLTSVVLPEGLPSLDIGSAAFQLNELTAVVIPEGVKEIRTYAFNKNNLRYVDIPKTVTKIGNKAFSDNKLVVVNFSLDIENVWLDRFSFNNNLLSEVTIIKDPGKIHHEAFKDNIGYDNNKNRVKVYTLNLNVDDQNHVFPYSHYHEMVMLKIENINDIPGMKDQVEIILSNGDKVKVDEKKCKSQDFNKKRQEQLANKNKTPGTTGNQGNAGKPGAPGAGNGNAKGNKPGVPNAPNAPQVPGKPPVPVVKGAPTNENVPNITKYKDMVKATWAQEAVKDLSDKQIITGYKNDYRPNDKMKKGEFAAILVKAFELDEVKTDLDFKDVKKTDWYYDAISKLAALDMVSGDGTGKFNPEEEITREQMIKMLMQLMNSKYPERLNTVEGVKGFKDQGKVSSWASEEMEQAMALNLISGFSDSTIKPQEETTRGQAAVVVYKALQLVE